MTAAPGARLGIGAAVDRKAQRAPHLDVVEGRLLGVEQEVLADIARVSVNTMLGTAPLSCSAMESVVSPDRPRRSGWPEARPPACRARR